jgi:hypothetical protein
LHNLFVDRFQLHVSPNANNQISRLDATTDPHVTYVLCNALLNLSQGHEQSKPSLDALGPQPNDIKDFGGDLSALTHGLGVKLQSWISQKLTSLVESELRSETVRNSYLSVERLLPTEKTSLAKMKKCGHIREDSTVLQHVLDASHRIIKRLRGRFKQAVMQAPKMGNVDVIPGSDERQEIMCGRVEFEKLRSFWTGFHGDGSPTVWINLWLESLSMVGFNA